MRTLKRVRWWSVLSARRSKHNLLNVRLRKEQAANSTDGAIFPPNARSHSTTQWRSAKPRPILESYEPPAPLDDVLVCPKLGQSVPYLEAYNLMEENADIIFDHENMMNEREFSMENAFHSDASNPRPASELPGPKSWPVVGCLPYMMRHKDFDPKRVYLFWQSVREEFGPIFRKDMPGHPHMVFITDPSDLQVMYQTTMYNPVRPGMQSLKKIRGPGGADGKTNTYYHVFNGKAGILAEQEDEWWRVRRQVQKPVTNTDVVGRYLPKMNDVSEAFVDRIRLIRNEDNEMPVTFNTDIYRWALESLGTIALERRLGCLDPHLEYSSRPWQLVRLVEQLLEAFHETENIKLWQYFPTTSIKKLQEAHDIFTAVALEAIKDTQEMVRKRQEKQNQNPRSGLSSPGLSSPVPSTGLSSPVSSTGLSSPVPSTGLSSPVYSIGLSSPVSSSGLTSPVSSTGLSSPVPSTGLSSPVSSTGLSSPVPSTGLTSPVPSTGLSSPVYSTGLSLPVSSTKLTSPVSSTSSSCPYHSQPIPNTQTKEEHLENSINTEEPSLLEMLLRLPGLSEGDVLTFLLDMLATGIDTTSHTAGNMLYLLARNPKEQARLREEIAHVIPDPKQMTPQQIGSLTYAKAVFRETLRVMPVNVAITRKLVQDTVLSGYLIPKGWQIVMPTMLMNFQEHIFPRASEFLPERFLRGSPLAPKHHFGFLPFSFGPRMCVGRRIAYQEIICLVVRILTEFNVEYKYEDIHLVNRLAYGPSAPLRLTFKDRR